jgi:ankyrin repeat protein
MARLFASKPTTRLPVTPYSANFELIEAAKTGDEGRARLALTKGGNVGFRDGTGRIALHYAAARRNLPIVVLLTEAGASVHSEDAVGLQPCHLACMLQPDQTRAAADDPAVVEYLGECGANAGCKADNGDTPLIYAARWGLLNIVQYLMRLPTVFRDALTHTGAAEMTAEELARTWGFDDVAKYIVMKGSVQTAKSVSSREYVTRLFLVP